MLKKELPVRYDIVYNSDDEFELIMKFLETHNNHVYYTIRRNYADTTNMQYSRIFVNTSDCGLVSSPDRKYTELTFDEYKSYFIYDELGVSELEW